MEPELAQEAVESMQAAPVAGAGNEREREKSVILERMAGGEAPPDVLHAEGVAEFQEDGGRATEEVTAKADAQEAVRKCARESVAREFPDALTEGTELFEACREEMVYLREANSPLADDPQAEFKIARRMARVLGFSQRGAVQESAVAPAKNTVAQRRTIRPMPTGGVPVESPVTTLERRVSGAKSTGEMLELMREIGTPFEALLKR